jgi:hypothetical protein
MGGCHPDFGNYFGLFLILMVGIRQGGFGLFMDKH